MSTENAAMPSIFIITDSGSDITQEEAKELGIGIVPLTTTFPDGTYRDGIDLDAPAFYEKIAATDDIPFTSQPSPAAFQEAFETALTKAQDIVCITLSSGISGTFQSACLGRSQLPEEDQARIHLVDSLTCSFSEGLLVRVAVERRDAGATCEEMVAELEQLRERVHIIALVDTLEFLRKGGRIPKALAMAGNLLSIHPVIATVEGKVGLLGQARGPKKGQNLLSKWVNKYGGVDFSLPFRIGCSGGGEELMERYWAENNDLYPSEHSVPPTSMLGSVIGTHSGPGCIAVAFFGNE